VSARVAAASPRPVPASAIAPANGGATFARVLARALADVDRSAAGLATSNGAALDARQSLELQAAVYRHVERLELASRLIDHGISAVKTVLQTRV
jgi:hypothetical protein